MKSLKAAAVVVGSLIASGAAAPAFAAEPMPHSIDNSTSAPFKNVRVLDTQLDNPAALLDAENAESPLYKVEGARKALTNSESPLYRGLSMQG
ncbi:hypothetical protein [Streptomyces sp. SID5910]|uniref:hypothetical protein n=1 Tax=Streptomyces sp. SID5910 TaxID=2690312 RepID=UPI00136E0604|nr:hypothetical protein [Streptomyces sp. SID5910]MYR43804.1 hypothetical protein [Streptomyces sp. SID5910]